MPGIQHRAESGARVAGGGLDEDVSETGGFQSGDQQGVQAKSAGEAEIDAGTSHGDDRMLDGPLDAGGQRRAQIVGNGCAFRKTEALVEPRAEAAVGKALRIEKRPVELGPLAAPHGHDFQEKIAEAVVARGGQPLDFVFFQVGAEAE